MTLKKYIFGMWLVISMIFLIACNEGVEKEVTEEDFTIEEITFKSDTNDIVAVLHTLTYYDKVIVSTETETLVVYLRNVTFIKKDNDKGTSEIHLKTTKKEDEISRKATIFLTSADVKKASKQYAEMYSESLEFSQK